MSKTIQREKLLGFMGQDPAREWKASDFQHDPRFIGYEAGTRLCDLCRMGLVCRVGTQDRFALYALTEKGRQFLDEKRDEQTAPRSDTEDTPSKTRQRDDFPDEVQESPAMDAVQDMIDARMTTPIGDLVGGQYPKRDIRQFYKDGLRLAEERTAWKVTQKPGKSPTGEIILALYRRFNMVPEWSLIV